MTRSNQVRKLSRVLHTRAARDVINAHSVCVFFTNRCLRKTEILQTKAKIGGLKFICCKRSVQGCVRTCTRASVSKTRSCSVGAVGQTTAMVRLRHESLNRTDLTLWTIKDHRNFCGFFQRKGEEIGHSGASRQGPNKQKYVVDFTNIIGAVPG